jgi:predicted ATPase
MQIESIELKNYRLFRHATFTALPAMATLVGANGSGKSTLFDVLSFLKDALTHNVAHAVARRGGFRELVSRGASGPIEIIIEFQHHHRTPHAVYQIAIANKSGRPITQFEGLGLTSGPQTDDRPRLVTMAQGRGTAVVIKDLEDTERNVETRKVKLKDPSSLAIKGLGQFDEFRVAAELSELLESWHVSDFHIGDARSSADAGHAEHLSVRGDNVAQVAHYLYEHHPDRFRRILEVMRARVPGITSVEAKPTVDGRLVLRFRDGNFEDPFIARYVSDGTIKMFAYLVLLHDPKPHPLLAVEEPENQLYPALLGELAEEFRDYGRRGGQVFVSTHSPEFLNGVKLDEVYWLVKKDGFGTVQRASDSKLLRDLYDEGDPPGALWKQRLFEGADPA